MSANSDKGTKNDPYTAALVIRRAAQRRADAAGHSDGRRLPLLSIVALAAIALSGFGASSAAAAQTVRKGVWGPPTTLNGQSLFPTYKDLGFGVFNMQARWDGIAPTQPADPTDPNDPAYVWPQYITDAVAEAGANGMQVQLLLMGTPPWANGGRSWQWVPNDPNAMRDFATAISKRYPSVKLWMIWGEPNRPNNFAPFTNAKPTGNLSTAQQVAPRNYAELLDAAYAGIKAVDPGDLVVGGNTFTASGKKKGPIRTYQWIKYMRLPDGSRPRMDLFGHNPWGFSKPNLKEKPSPHGAVEFSDLSRLLKVLDKNFKGKKLKLYLAEWGIPTGFKDLDLGYSLKLKEAKVWLKAAFKIMRSKRYYSLGWVHLIDKERNSTGLLDANGIRKPLYQAFKSVK